MRQNRRFLLPVTTLFAIATLAGCYTSKKEVDTVPAPAPVVQVNPPAVVASPPATSQSTTTTWDNGAVVQKNTVTQPQPGELQKQTTTTWGNGAGPSTTVTTTTNP
jgi:ABC-type uncharacterized transport system auxiliary subunit